MEGLTDDEVWQVLQYADTGTPRRNLRLFRRRTPSRDAAAPRAIRGGRAGRGDSPLTTASTCCRSCPTHRVDEILPLLPIEDRRDIQRLQSYPRGDRRRVDDDRSRDADPESDRSRGTGGTRTPSQRFGDDLLLVRGRRGQLLRGIVSTRQLVSSLGKPIAHTGRDDGNRCRRCAGRPRTKSRSPKRSRRFNLLAIPVVDSRTTVARESSRTMT